MKEEEEQASSPPVTADPAIKLFGRTIPVTGGGSNEPAEAAEDEKSLKSGKQETDLTVTATGTNSVAVATAEDSQGRSNEHKEAEEGGQEVGGQGKNLKKPDKPAPCPRCESLDTKFCYYNNYNINQPRHFCKNCQRYWTAGGTLRNVPVGAGRRKNKYVGLQARNGTMADQSVVAMVEADSQEDVQQLLPCAGSRISPLKHPQIPHQCPTLPALDASSGGEISMMEGFQVAGEVHQITAMNRSQNGVNGAGELPSEVEKKEIVDECASSLPEQDLTTTQEAANTAVPIPLHPILQPDVGGLYRPMAVGDAGVLAAGGTGGPFGFYNGAWPYGFNVGWSGTVPAGSHGVVGTGQLLSGNGMATWNTPSNGVWIEAGVLPWTSLLPGMPGSPWVVPPGWGGWTVPLPWAAAVAGAPATASTVNGCVLPISRLPGTTIPVLGKHPRDQPEGRRIDGALWAPKSLRVDDPKEAAQSSVWNALGMPNPPDSVVSGSMFKAFQPKTEAKMMAERHPQ
ncbi:unnamed protein product [Sphagnum troendelagicum]|uniref:Dof-type domain-containing protein n=1 Tax=Sphagnum troendelagicum TaxID=128251 RepID=A0ABP0U6Y3_9BRYO